MRVRALGHRQLRHQARVPQVGNVHDARAHAEVAHVADVDDVAVTHHLHPVAFSAQIGVPDELESAGVQDGWQAGRVAQPAEPTGPA